MSRPARQSLARIFRWPLCLVGLTLAGLIVGLLGSGAADVFAWFALGTVIAVILRSAGRGG